MLRDLERAASADEIAHLLVGAFARYGCSYTMAGIVAEPALPAQRQAGFVLANTMPEGWGRRSVTQGYARHDPPALHQRDAVRMERRGAGAPGRTDNLETAGGAEQPVRARRSQRLASRQVPVVMEAYRPEPYGFSQYPGPCGTKTTHALST